MVFLLQDFANTSFAGDLTVASFFDALSQVFSELVSASWVRHISHIRTQVDNIYQGHAVTSPGGLHQGLVIGVDKWGLDHSHQS